MAKSSALQITGEAQPETTVRSCLTPTRVVNKKCRGQSISARMFRIGVQCARRMGAQEGVKPLWNGRHYSLENLKNNYYLIQNHLCEYTVTN